MKNDQIITSLIDDDRYTAVMGGFYTSRSQNFDTQFGYTLRSSSVDLVPYIDEIREQVNALATIQLSEVEREFLTRTLNPRDHGYIRRLSDDRLDPANELVIRVNPEVRGGLEIFTASGLDIVKAGKYEMPVLAIISEIYNRNRLGDKYDEALSVAKTVATAKIDKVIDLVNRNPEVDYKFAEFGTRRRFSREFQEWLVCEMSGRLSPEILLGTSNMRLGMLTGLNTVGTMGHQLVMSYQGFNDYCISQHAALSDLARHTGGDVLVLTDTLGQRMWDEDFDTWMAHIFNGQRHDSGCPIEWGHDRIAKYHEFGIDPKTKDLMFSDNLTLDSSFELSRLFGAQTNVLHGIGTHWTNDLGGFEGHKSLSQVFKLLYCNGKPVVKLSNDMDLKAQCPCPYTLEYVKAIAKGEIKGGLK